MEEGKRPRVLHELSRHLAARLETAIQEGSEERRVRVYLSHPLEALEGRDAAEAGPPAGVLYLYRLLPERDVRERESVGEPETRGAGPGAARVRRFPALWMRLRYAFLVVGGTLEEELGILAAALRSLHDVPYVEASAVGEAGEAGLLPLAWVPAPEAWREIGMEEHRLTVSFEVAAPIASGKEDVVGPILERELRFGKAAPEGAGHV